MLTRETMKVGGRYNWRNQPERLVYLGRNWSGNGYWHQFEKVGEPGRVWCEVLDADLPMLEETAEHSRAIFDAKVQAHGYVDRVTGERIYDPARLGAGSTAGGVDTFGLTQQLARAVEASDEGHDPFCMAILRGKDCSCGLDERTAGVALDGGPKNG